MTHRFGAWLLSGLAAMLLSACATIGEDVSQTAPIVEVEASVDRDTLRSTDFPEPVRSEPAMARGGGVEVIPLQQAMPEPGPAAPDPVASSPFTFRVIEAEKDGSHPFFGDGHDLGFVVDGVQGRKLVVIRGETYTFQVDTGIQHDFYLSTSEIGWGAAAWVDGVAGQFIYQGEVTFTPDRNTPDLLYYQCRNHPNMGGEIHIVDNEEQAAVARAELEAERSEAPLVAEAPTEGIKVTETQVRQKLQLADMFVNESAAADRIIESGIQAALDLYRAARQNFIDATAAADRGDLEIALLLVDESLRLMSEASLHVPRDIEEEARRAQFEEYYEGVRTFRDSYVRNVERMAKRDRDKIRHIDLDAIEQVLSRSRKLADDGSYADALALLEDAHDTLTGALTEMLADESISYELVFETPREEYEYELSRYESYERLVPIAIEQRKPSERSKELMMQFVDRAREIRGLVDAEVEGGDFQEAILMLQGATSHIQRALQVVGVR